MTKKTEKSKAENDELFKEVMIPNIQPLYQFALRLTLDQDDANDLVQDTYLNAYRFIESFQEGTNAKAWLFRILKNNFINRYRKQSKAPNKVEYQEAEGFLFSEKSNYTDSIDLRDKIFKGLIGDEVSDALNRLPVDFRTVIVLCDLEGFTYEEISKILDIPIGTVRSRLHRARNMLKSFLHDYATKMGYNK